MRTELFIGGEWRSGSGAAFASRDPATGAEVWRGNSANAADAAAACAAARAAFPAWARPPHEERVAMLRRFADVLTKRADSLAAAISREVGKPRWEARTEVQSMIGKIEISIEAHAKRCGEFRGGSAITRFRPHGVVAVFGPFNFPGHLPNGHIAPALLAGNTIVLKPSERAPGVAAAMIETWDAAGLPAGALNLLQGGRETGQALAAQDELDGVFFTGSAAAGLGLHRHFAARPDKILALEMGGNNPLVAWDAANLDAAALLIVQSAYLTAGQRCTCARRLIVPADASGEHLVARAADYARTLRYGAPGEEPEPFMGPVISAEAAAALVAAQTALVARGAKPIAPLHHQKPDTGLVSPGLLDVTAVADRMDEEIFGPLLQVIRVRDFDAAIVEANATRFGLAAGLISDNSALWERFRLEVRAGVMNWNHVLPGASSAAPFGGVGFSGNHRPSAYLAADYCSFPVASIESASLAAPAQLPPGLVRAEA